MLLQNKKGKIHNKMPMGHIAHLRNHFKSINTFQQSYGYIITLIWSRKKPHYFLLKNWMLYICKTMSPLHPRSLVEIGSVDYYFSLMYFHYFVIKTSLWKGSGPSFEQTWISFTQECFVPSLVVIEPVVLEKKISKFHHVFSPFCIYLPFGKGRGPSFEQN